MSSSRTTRITVTKAHTRFNGVFVMSTSVVYYWTWMAQILKKAAVTFCLKQSKEVRGGMSSSWNKNCHTKRNVDSRIILSEWATPQITFISPGRKHWSSSWALLLKWGCLLVHTPLAAGVNLGWKQWRKKVLKMPPQSLPCYCFVGAYPSSACLPVLVYALRTQSSVISQITNKSENRKECEMSHFL